MTHAQNGFGKDAQQGLNNSLKKEDQARRVGGFVALSQRNVPILVKFWWVIILMGKPVHDLIYETIIKALGYLVND